MKLRPESVGEHNVLFRIGIPSAAPFSARRQDDHSDGAKAQSGGAASQLHQAESAAGIHHDRQFQRDYRKGLPGTQLVHGSS